MDYKVGDYIKFNNQNYNNRLIIFIFKIIEINIKELYMKTNIIEIISNGGLPIHTGKFCIMGCKENNDLFLDIDHVIITDKKEINRLKKMEIFQ